jgi:hypothetical protein
MMRTAISVVTCLMIALLTGTSCLANKTASDLTSELSKKHAVGDLFERLRAFVIKYYPQSDFEKSPDHMHFEWKKRTFWIHLPNKVGDWQEAAQMKGPDRKGILGDVELRPGLYEGQAEVPQKFDHYYYETLVMAPASKQKDSYLYVHLDFPEGTSEEFLRGFRSIINQYELQ